MDSIRIRICFVLNVRKIIDKTLIQISIFVCFRDNFTRQNLLSVKLYTYTCVSCMYTIFKVLEDFENEIEN